MDDGLASGRNPEGKASPACAEGPSSGEPVPVVATHALHLQDAQPTGVPRRLLRWLRRFFWLDEGLAHRRLRAFHEGHPGWPEFRMARRALAHADLAYRGDAKVSPAVLLYRAAASLMIQAHLARAGMGLDAAHASQGGWARIADSPLGHWLAANLPGDELELVASGLSAHGESWLARLPSGQSRQAALGLRRVAEWLGEPLMTDTVGVRNLLWQRWLRIGSLLLVSLVGLWLLGKNRPNLARDSSVTVTNDDPRFGGDPKRLVDGCRTKLAFHTARGGTATLDLGTVHEISRVVVYNRADCCQDRAVPMKLEISQDATKYQQIAVRDRSFDAWTVDFPPARARYVRLVSTNPRMPFHLSEVEIY
jgi:hypothetical protein